MGSGNLVSESKPLKKWLENKYGREEAARILTFGPFARGKKTSALRRFARWGGNESRLELAELEIKELVDRELRLAEIALQLSTEAKAAPSAKERDHLISIEKDAEVAMLRVQEYRTRLMIDASELRKQQSDALARELARRPLPIIKVDLDLKPDNWEEKKHRFLETAKPDARDNESIASLDLLYRGSAELRRKFNLELLGYDFNQQQGWIKIGNKFGCLKLAADRGKRRLLAEFILLHRAPADGAALLEAVGKWHEPTMLSDIAARSLATRNRIAKATTIPKNLRSASESDQLLASVLATCALVEEFGSSFFQARSSEPAPF